MAMNLDQFVMGALTMASWVAGLFFLRFWRNTHDRLFLSFAAAFFLLGLTRVGLAMTDSTTERHTYLYLVRFVAFALILIAIIDKNRPRHVAQSQQTLDEAAAARPSAGPEAHS
jgi:hypothetical protein